MSNIADITLSSSEELNQTDVFNLINEYPEDVIANENTTNSDFVLHDQQYLMSFYF
jgi:hypothetical protein